MNKQTTLYQLTETSQFMMSFVIVTEKNNAIVIDGGRPEDMPLLKQYLDGRHISAWILTHPHGDHISGLIYEIERNGGADFDIEKVVYAFPSYEALLAAPSVPDREYFEADLGDILPKFEAIEHFLGNRRSIVSQGDTLDVDECHFEFIYTYHDGLFSNPMNDASLVFTLTTPRKKIIFLGDLGPEGGDILYEESRHLLKSDIVQMAHHGHMNVGMEVYAAIDPEICLWCCPEWLWNEPEIPHYLTNRKRLRSIQRNRMYGTTITRAWMEKLGVKTHYVTKDGTNTLYI